MSKHTLGPWNITGPHKNTTDNRIISCGEKTICTTSAYEFWNCSIEETDANGNLIAAAPELLSRLQSFCDAWEDYVLSGRKDFPQEQFEKAKLLIKTITE